MIALASLAAPPADAQFIPNDTHWDSFPPAPGNHSGQWNMRDIQMPLAWEITTGSPEIVIAIVDGQAVHTHPDLVEGRWFNLGEDLNRNGVFDDAPASQGGDVDGLDTDNNGYADDFHGWDFADDDNDPSDGPGTLTRHGTQVAGIPLARTHNAEGVAGIAGGDGTAGSGARYMVLSWDDSGASTPQEKDAQMADAVEYATANGAHVINMSFVDPAPDELDGALDAAHAAGVVLIAARGNIGQAPSCGAKGWFPANHTQTLSVGAVVESGSRWTNSCLNPDLMAPGGESVVTTGFQFPSAPYNTFGGTSAAAPHVAGVAALLLSVQPALTPTDVEAILLATADEAGCAEIDPSYTRVQECGAGLVDAYAALVYTLENYGGHLTQNLTIPAGETWNLGNVTLEFAPSANLIVEGTLNADSTTFTASDQMQGWGGISFYSPSSTLKNSTVENVSSASSLFLANATVELEGTLIDGKPGANTHGVWLAGPNSNLTMEGVSEIRDHDLYGILAGGGYAIVRDLSEISGNGYGGLRSNGSNTEVRLKQANVLNNFGHGVFWDAGGFVDVRDAFTTTIVGNEGGLDSDYYAQVDAGMCVGTTCAHAIHDLRDNTQNGTFFDARAIEGSIVFAEGNYWAQSSVSNLILIEDATSVIEVEPISQTPSLVGEGGSGSSAAYKGGGGDPDVRGLTIEALRQYNASELKDGTRDPLDLAAADAALLSALTQAESPDERRRAFGTASWLLIREPLSGATAWLETQAALSGDRRPWALRALLAARSAQGRSGDARSIASTLATDYAGSEHETIALVEAVRLAVGADDWSGAHSYLAVLESLAAQPTESGDGERMRERRADAAETARISMGLPFTGVPALWSSFDAEPDATKTMSEDVPALSLPLPNPSRTTATLTLTLPQEAHVRAEVLDLLGRRVLSLADAPFEAGRMALVAEVSALRAGVYVVRVVVDDGQSTRLTRRLTVVR